VIPLNPANPTPVIVIPTRGAPLRDESVIFLITVNVAVAVLPNKSVALTVWVPALLATAANEAEKLPNEFVSTDPGTVTTDDPS